MTSFLAAAWAAARSVVGRTLLGVLMLMASLWLAQAYGRATGRAQGVATERAAWSARAAADEARARKIAARQAVAGSAVGAAVAARQAEVRTVTQTLIREVPIYVTAEADARCDVPAGFVRLHDAAAAGVSAAPNPTGRPADAPSDLALSAVAETVTDNYGACLGAFEQVKGWQGWWAAVSAVASGREAARP
jgi:hypothetical protein